MKTLRNLRWSFLLASVATFLLSLTQDGFYIDRTDRDAYASCIGLLLIGWLGMLDGVFAWLANPLLLFAWISILFGRSKLLATSLAMVALGFSLSFLMHNDMLTNEAGGRSAITEYASDYWLWNLSIAFSILAAALVTKPTPKAKTHEETLDGDAQLSQRLKQIDSPTNSTSSSR